MSRSLKHLLTQVPLLPDFHDLVGRQVEAPAAQHCCSPACKKFDAMHGRELIAVVPFPRCIQP